MNQPEVFHEIYDFYEIPFWQTTWFSILTIVGAISLILLIVYFFMTRKKRVLPSWEIAIQQLHKINIERCINKHDFKKIYFEISTILKHYLQERFGWNIIDKTDDELMKYLQKNQFNTTLLESLKKLFLSSSFVKYADEVALKTQVEEDLKMAFKLIDQTIPTE